MFSGTFLNCYKCSHRRKLVFTFKADNKSIRKKEAKRPVTGRGHTSEIFRNSNEFFFKTIFSHGISEISFQKLLHLSCLHLQVEQIVVMCLYVIRNQYSFVISSHHFCRLITKTHRISIYCV